jgi:multicomponent Na+:H+ antiporter subunit D
MPEALPPALILVAAALLTGPARGPLRAAVVLLAPLVTLYAVWQVPDGVAATAPFLDYELQIVEGSPVRRLFATIFAFMAFAGGLFAFRQARWYELSAALLYAAGAVGVCFAGDLITLFVFWELMALFSTVVIWCGGTPAARSAGIRYGIMHLLGGVLLKVGIEGIAVHTGSVDIAPLAADNFDRWMVLIGVLVNAAAPPVSAWLSDAYPESSATGAVFLSAFTTKTAILALILMFPGETLLVWVGLYMVMYGILYALLENDVRRILAYSIVNQVGFMVCAVGIGTPMALNGAAAHAFAHILYKALLFMSAGVVLYRTGRHLCTDLGGLFRSMPLTTVCAVIGALAISGFPLTSGFTTKTLISQAAADQHLAWVWFLLSAASAGVFLHAGIKYPWFVFFQRDAGLRPADAPWNMAAAMVLMATLCIVLGISPGPLYALLPYPVAYDPYTPGKVLFYLQLLLFSGLAFFVLLPLMQRTRTVSLDTDWLWRVAAAGCFARMEAVGERLGAIVAEAGHRVRRRAGRIGAGLFAGPRPDRERPGLFARPWAIGTTALWIALLLSLYVFVYFL